MNNDTDKTRPETERSSTPDTMVDDKAQTNPIADETAKPEATPEKISNAEVDEKTTETTAQDDTNPDDYPHGLKLVLLLSAALVAVFLIALDQVSPSSSPASPVLKYDSLTNTLGILRQSSAQQSLRSQPSSTASTTSAGTPPPTS
jgi:hypothetical protein